MGYLTDLRRTSALEDLVIDRLRDSKLFASSMDVQDALRANSFDINETIKYLKEKGMAKSMQGYFQVWSNGSNLGEQAEHLAQSLLSESKPSHSVAKSQPLSNGSASSTSKVVRLASSAFSRLSNPLPLTTGDLFDVDVDDVVDVSQSEKAVDAVLRQLGTHDSVPQNWSRIVYSYLDIKPVEGLETLLEAATIAARSALDSKRSSKLSSTPFDERKLLRSIISELVEPLTLLDPVPKERELSVTPVPSEEEINRIKSDLDNLNPRSAADKMLRATRALCQSYLDLLSWVESEDKKRKSCYKKFEDLLLSVYDNKQARLQMWAQTLAEAEADLAKALHSKVNIEQRIADMIGPKASEAEKAGAYIDLVNSSDPTDIAVISNRNLALADVKERERQVSHIKLEGEHLNKSAELLDAVVAYRKMEFEGHANQFAAIRKVVESEANSGLVETIPRLCQALKGFCAHHRERKLNAESTLEQRRNELEEHIRMFEDECPTEKQNLEARVRELQNVTLQSTSALRQLADSQDRFWGSMYDALPVDAKRVLLENFEQLRTGLEVGPMKDMLARFASPERWADAQGAKSIPWPQSGPADAFGVHAGDATARVSEPSRDSTGSVGVTGQKRPREDDGQVNPKRSAVTSTDASSHSGPSAIPSPSLAKPTEQEIEAKKALLGRVPLAVGQVAYTKFNFGGVRKWLKGNVVAANADGTYHMLYEDGDRYTEVERKYLYTIQQIEAEKIDTSRDPQTSTNDTANKDGSCVIC